MNLSTLTALIPAEITFGIMIRFIAIFAAAVLILSLLFRLLLGKNSALNKAICAGIGVLCIYVLTIIVYTFSPGNLEQFLVPLPFVKFSGDYLYIMPLSDTAFPAICAEVMSLVILVLLYNLTESLLPQGQSVVTWFVLRALTTIAAMVIHYFLTALTGSFLPELLVSYGPTILLVCLIASVLMGALSVVLGLLMVVVNPILGLLFSFFFTNKFGKQLSKAMLTSAVLTALVALLNHFGYSIVCINASSLLSYIPLLVILLALWYLISKKL